MLLRDGKLFPEEERVLQVDDPVNAMLVLYRSVQGVLRAKLV